MQDNNCSVVQKLMNIQESPDKCSMYKEKLSVFYSTVYKHIAKDGQRNTNT